MVEEVLIATPDGTRPVVLETVPDALDSSLDASVENVTEEKADAGEYAIRPFIPAVEVTFNQDVTIAAIEETLEEVSSEEGVELTLPEE